MTISEGIRVTANEKKIETIHSQINGETEMTNKLTSRIRILAVVGLVAVNMFFAAASFADTFVHGGPKSGWHVDGNKHTITDVYRK